MEFKDWSAKKKLAAAKHADLITLPESVQGTNCGNCEYFVKKTKFCKHEEVQQTVSDKMCCKYWDHPDAKRAWEKA